MIFNAIIVNYRKFEFKFYKKGYVEVHIFF